MVGRTTERLDAVRFTFVQVLTVGVVCAVPGFFLGGYDMGAGAWWAAAFTGLLATAQQIGWRGLAGPGLILSAILLVEVVPLLRGEVVDDPAVEPTVHG